MVWYGMDCHMRAPLLSDDSTANQGDGCMQDKVEGKVKVRCTLRCRQCRRAPPSFPMGVAAATPLFHHAPTPRASRQRPAAASVY